MIKIDINKVLPNCIFTDASNELEFSITSKLDTTIPYSISFLTGANYVDQLLKNSNISYVITTEELNTTYQIAQQKKVIISKQPKYDFYVLHNYTTQHYKKSKPSEICDTVKIGQGAVISPTGVFIGKNTVIGANVVILDGVHIGENCIIGPGSVIGNDSFECVKHNNTVLTVKHDGEVIIKNNVELGSNVTIDKGLMGHNTVIENEVKMDNQVHVSHNVSINQCSLLAASVTIAGNTVIGKNVWIGPGAIISNRLTIKDNASISIGSVVVNNVKENETVTGNFAIDHKKFMKNHFRSLKK